MTGPFDDPDALYVVLVTAAGTASLWPAWAEVPAGWTITHGPTDRDACLTHLVPGTLSHPHSRCLAP
jgi:MbtH protein